MNRMTLVPIHGRQIAPLSTALLSALVLSACQPTQEMPSGRIAIDETKLVDLTYPFDSTTVYWPTAHPFRLEVVARGPTADGYWYASNDFCAAEHGGTHLDAPIHFSEGGWSAEEIPIERFVGPAVVVDVSDSCARNPDYLVRVEDLLAWETRNGAIPDGAIVLFRSGWGTRWPDRTRVFGSETPADPSTLHFPGLSAEAAALLARDRRVDAVGIDTPSIDHGPARRFTTHQTLAVANIGVFENVARLELLPERGAMVIALPIKIAGGTGGPARIIAVIP